MTCHSGFFYIKINPIIIIKTLRTILLLLRTISCRARPNSFRKLTVSSYFYKNQKPHVPLNIGNILTQVILHLGFFMDLNI